MDIKDQGAYRMQVVNRRFRSSQAKVVLHILGEMMKTIADPREDYKATCSTYC